MALDSMVSSFAGRAQLTQTSAPVSKAIDKAG